MIQSNHYFDRASIDAIQGEEQMSKTNGKRSLVDPSRLKLQDEEDKQILQVIIETPKGSRNKYASILIKKFSR